MEKKHNFTKLFLLSLSLVSVVMLLFSLPVHADDGHFSGSSDSSGHGQLTIPYNIGPIDYVDQHVIDMSVNQVYAALNGTLDYPNTYILTTFEKDNLSDNYTLLFQCNYGINNFITDLDSYYFTDQYINIYGTFSVLCFYNAATDTVTLQGGHWNVSPSYQSLNNDGHYGYILSCSDDSVVLDNGIVYANHHEIIVPPTSDDPDVPIVDNGHVIEWGHDYNFPDDTTEGKVGGMLNNFFKTFTDNLKSFFKPAFDKIQTTVDNIKGFVSDIKDSVDTIKEGFSSIVDVFNNFKDLGTDENGDFSIFTAIRRLIIPDDLSDLKERISQFITDTDPTGGAVLYINTISGLFDSIKSQNVPSFTVPSFGIGGVLIPETVISFQFLVPYMGYIRSIMSAFMWLAFIIYCIKDFPNILNGTFSSVDHSLEVGRRIPPS